MADIGQGKEQFLVDPTKEIKEMWNQVKKAEIVDRIARAKADIAQFQNARVIDLKAKIKMLELELAKLNSITVE